MRSSHGTLELALILGFLLGLPGGAMAQAEVQVQEYEGTPYLTGGITVDEREALQERAEEEGFNLKVVLASEEGAYLSNVNVRITDSEGTLRLEATTTGPWLYTRLPAGEYTVEGSRDGSTGEASVTVAEEGRRQVVVRIP